MEDPRIIIHQPFSNLCVFI